MLICKPYRKSTILYAQTVDKGQTFVLRSLSPDCHTCIIQPWNEVSYWNEFWHYSGDISITAIYKAVLKDNNAHAFAGIVDEQLICIVDLIQAANCDLNKHFRFAAPDSVARFTFHPCSRLQRTTIHSFVHWYFSIVQTGHLYAIPNIHDHTYCQFLASAGFTFHGNYICTRQAVSVFRLSPIVQEASYN